MLVPVLLLVRFPFLRGNLIPNSALVRTGIFGIALAVAVAAEAGSTFSQSGIRLGATTALLVVALGPSLAWSGGISGYHIGPWHIQRPRLRLGVDPGSSFFQAIEYLTLECCFIQELIE